jgi:hypothetical protein
MLTKIPFSAAQFFSVIEEYNRHVFPSQIIFMLSSLICFMLIFSKYHHRSRIIGVYLGILWIWMGLVYHLAFFTRINPAAIVFGIGFILQGLLIIASAFKTNHVQYYHVNNPGSYMSIFIILFGIVLYPITGLFFSMSFESTIVLGLPCPTTIMTFGFFMLARENFPKYLLAIPTLWALIGLSASWHFGVYQDTMLIVSPITAIISIMLSKSSAGKIKTLTN